MRFNTAGPCEPRFHDMLPAAERLPEAPRLVAQGAYFVVHAPRQTGKTTIVRALARALTAQGRYARLSTSTARPARSREMTTCVPSATSSLPCATAPSSRYRSSSGRPRPGPMPRTRGS
jgi:hypothetical protein